MVKYTERINETYPVCSRGVGGPGPEAAGWFGSAGVGRCRQCLEAGKLSVWTDYEPRALDSESTQSCRSEREREEEEDRGMKDNYNNNSV